MVGGLIAGHLVVTEPEGRAGVIRCYGSPVNKCFSKGAFILGVNVTLSVTPLSLDMYCFTILWKGYRLLQTRCVPKPRKLMSSCGEKWKGGHQQRLEPGH